MKFLLLFLGFFFTVLASAQHSVSGIVFADSSGTPLTGVEVTIPDLRLSELSKSDGRFHFRGIATDHVLLQFKHLGYKTQLLTLWFYSDTSIKVVMQVSAIEGHEVVITGNLTGSEHEETSAPVYFVGKEEMREDAPGNVIDAIARTPGVSQVSTGPQVSKPVVRGLGFNRVLVLHDGIRQEGQQWGDEHGVEIDAFSADRIEILRGPASLIYGSDAMGGVINILEPFPAAWNSLEGELLFDFHENARQYGFSSFIQGNNNGFLWRFRASYKDAGNYRTPSEIIYNSLFNEMDASAMLGLQKKWGYSHNSFSVYRSQMGLMEGDTVPEELLKSRIFGLPFQSVQHRKFTSRTHILKEMYHVDILAGFQHNIREEFEVSPDTAGLHFNLYSSTLDLQFHWPRQDGWEYIFGLNGMYQVNRIGGEEVLIPEFEIADAGIFFFTKRTWNKNTFSMGARYSYRNMKVHRAFRGPMSFFMDTTHHFHGPSFSIGVTSKFRETVSLKNSLSSGFRAPNPFELYAQGVHEGTRRFEYGNPFLKQEMSFQYDLGLIIERKKIHFEPAFFANLISNYSYLIRLPNTFYIQNGDTLESWFFLQSDASLYGFEIMLDWHPMELLHIRNVFSWVEGRNILSGADLPMIPPPRLVTDIKLEIPVRTPHEKWGKAWFKITGDLNAEQYRVAEFETPSKPYLLLHFGTGITRKMRHAELKFRLSIQNILNTEYAPHLSRLRYFDIYNPGRNFVIGIEMPFEHSKSEQ